MITAIVLDVLPNVCYTLTVYLSQLMWLWYLSHRRPAKAQTSLHIPAASPEPSLFTHMKYGKTKGPTKNQTSSPTGWLCMHVWRMSLQRTKSTILSWDGSFYHFQSSPIDDYESDDLEAADTLVRGIFRFYYMKKTKQKESKKKDYYFNLCRKSKKEEVFYQMIVEMLVLKYTLETELKWKQIIHE